jgi:hypothetical protein
MWRRLWEPSSDFDVFGFLNQGKGLRSPTGARLARISGSEAQQSYGTALSFRARSAFCRCALAGSRHRCCLGPGHRGTGQAEPQHRRPLRQAGALMSTFQSDSYTRQVRSRKAWAALLRIRIRSRPELSRRSFVSKSCYWIDPQRASRWDVAGNGGDHQQHHRYSGKRYGIVRCYSVKQMRKGREHSAQ